MEEEFDDPGGIGIWVWVSLGLVLVVCSAKWIKGILDAQYFDCYSPPSELPLRATTIDTQHYSDLHICEKVQIQGTPHSAFPVFFHYPSSAQETSSSSTPQSTTPSSSVSHPSSPSPSRVPCIVLVYGIAQDMKCAKEFADVFVRHGFAVACHEQIGRGERPYATEGHIVQKLFRLRERGWSTVVELRRLVDWLHTRPEIDQNKIYLLGISLGSMLGSHALALEPRFSAAVLMWGGCDFSLIVTESEIAKMYLSRWQRFVLKWGERVFKPVPADPMTCLHLIGRRLGAGARPIFFQNPLFDEVIPRESIELMHRLTAEPKTIKWYNCTHEVITNEVRRQIVVDQVQWFSDLAANDDPDPQTDQ